MRVRHSPSGSPGRDAVAWSGRSDPLNGDGFFVALICTSGRPRSRADRVGVGATASMPVATTSKYVAGRGQGSRGRERMCPAGPRRVCLGRGASMEAQARGVSRRRRPCIGASANECTCRSMSGGSETMLREQAVLARRQISSRESLERPRPPSPSPRHLAAACSGVAPRRTSKIEAMRGTDALSPRKGVIQLMALTPRGVASTLRSSSGVRRLPNRRRRRIVLAGDHAAQVRHTHRVGIRAGVQARRVGV